MLYDLRKDHLSIECEVMIGKLHIYGFIPVSLIIQWVTLEQTLIQQKNLEIMLTSHFYQKCVELIQKNVSFVVATVVKTEGSTLAKVGFRAILSQEGKIIHGTLGGGCPEGLLRKAAKRVLEENTPRTFTIHLLDEEESIREMKTPRGDYDLYADSFCGGTMDIYLEPCCKDVRIVVIVETEDDYLGEKLKEFSSILGIQAVTVNWRILSLLEKREKPTIYRDDFVVILTRGRDDVEILNYLSAIRPRYVGLLASHKRSKRDFGTLRKMGIDEKFIKSVRTPVGVSIGAITPEEIALSIVAEIVQEIRSKRLNKGGETNSL